MRLERERYQVCTFDEDIRYIVVNAFSWGFTRTRVLFLARPLDLGLDPTFRWPARGFYCQLQFDKATGICWIYLVPTARYPLCLAARPSDAP